MNIWNTINSRGFRKWLYGVSLAAIPILIAAGKMTNEEAALWMNLIAAILGVSSMAMALSHLPPKEDPYPGLNMPEDIIPTEPVKRVASKAKVAPKKAPAKKAAPAKKTTASRAKK